MIFFTVIDETIEEDFINQALIIEKMDKRKALDIVHKNIDLMLRRDKIRELDDYIGQIDSDNCTIRILLAILTAALPVKTKLSCWKSLIKTVERKLIEQGEEVESNLRGLR